jgi:FMN reductase
MSTTTIIGISGNINRPSKTSMLVNVILDEIAHRHLGHTDFYDLLDAAPGSFDPGTPYGTPNHLVDAIEQADMLVVGTPVFKGGYTGLLKHVFDLVHPDALRGKPVILSATGGSNRHALVIEHHLRPLFAFFGALTVPTGIYMSASDLIETEADVRKKLGARIETAVSQLSAWQPQAIRQVSVVA